MRDIVSLFGSDVFVLAVDDNVKLSICVTAVTKQVPLRIHVSYKIRLPEPSVYAACEIKPPSSRADPEITYSGSTYIAIRSGKHDSSTAYTDGRDFDQFMGLKEFDKVVKHENTVKLIGMFLCDGGPHESPRFPKTLEVAIEHFKKYNLDALLTSTYAQGLSTYNQIKRRMTALSKVLSGILLPHETFGTHLDLSRKTIDTNLEKRNFKTADEIWVKVWEKIVLDNFTVVADYVQNVAKDPVDLNEKWISAHCRISRYLLQIVQCNDSKYCGHFQIAWKSVFSSRFLPAPVQMRQISEGPAVPTVRNVKVSDRFVDLWKRIDIQQLIPNSGFSQMSHGLYCPSLRAKVKNRVSRQCGIYYPSNAACKHRRQDVCGLEVLGNKVIDEKKDISHEEQESAEILVADSDDDHQPIMN